MSGVTLCCLECIYSKEVHVSLPEQTEGVPSPGLPLEDNIQEKSQIILSCKSYATPPPPR